MDENELKTLASSKGFNPIILEKDYYLTKILEGISRSNISKNLIFRGGTALNKLYFGYYRLSEDIDFILINVKKYSPIQKEIRNLCKDIGLNHKDSIFSMRNFVDNFNFIGPLNIPNTIKIDINYNEKPILNTEYKQVKHIFKDIPTFSIQTLQLKELASEKIRAILTRKEPRDYFDVWYILRKYPGLLEQIKELVYKKCRYLKESADFKKIFDNLELIRKLWDQRMNNVLIKPVRFDVIIKDLREIFNA